MNSVNPQVLVYFFAFSSQLPVADHGSPGLRIVGLGGAPIPARSLVLELPRGEVREVFRDGGLTDAN